MSAPGALPWAAESTALVSISGSGAGGRVCPVFVRRSMSGTHRRARKRFSLAVRHRFFWQDKRNGVGKIRPQVRSTWTATKDAVLETAKGRGLPPKRVFGYFLHEQKVPRGRLWNSLDRLQGLRPCCPLRPPAGGQLPHEGGSQGPCGPPPPPGGAGAGTHFPLAYFRKYAILYAKLVCAVHTANPTDRTLGGYTLVR